MKNFICSIVLVVLALLFNTEPGYAAFPAHASSEAVSGKTEKRSFEAFINSAIERYQLPVPPVSDVAGEDGGVWSIIAFALGLAGLAAIIAAFLLPTVSEILIAGAIGLGIGAIITGVKGKRHSRLRGLGIAGFVLGIVDLSILVLAIVALVAFLVVYLM